MFIIINTHLYYSRFREVPSFGRDSIRRFTNNVSELNKLGARDYENLLQVRLFRLYRDVAIVSDALGIILIQTVFDPCF